MSANPVMDYMAHRMWSIDRMAVELETDAPTLRWYLAGYPAQSVRQQHRLDAICRAVERLMATRQPITLPDDEMTLVAVPGARDRIYRPDRHDRLAKACINGHLYTPETTYISPQGRRACRVCRATKSSRSKARLMAARDAMRTLNGRGLRDMEIAQLLDLAVSTVADLRRGTYATDQRVNQLQRLVALTNDLVGRSREAAYGPRPLVEVLAERWAS